MVASARCLQPLFRDSARHQHGMLRVVRDGQAHECQGGNDDVEDNEHEPCYPGLLRALGLVAAGDGHEHDERHCQQRKYAAQHGELLKARVVVDVESRAGHVPHLLQQLVT